MSLDVYLEGEPKQVDCVCMDCGNTHKKTEYEVYYTSNITHNLGKMAQAAEIYRELWRPEEIGITKAKQLIQPLTEGLARLKASPNVYKSYDDADGWGTYDQFVPWVKDYLQACIENPESNIKVSR